MTAPILDPPPGDRPRSLLAAVPWERLVIWTLFLAALYVLRHFFAIIFLTFVITFITRSVAGAITRRLSPRRELTWLDRLATLVAFGALLLSGYGVGRYIGPQLVAQGETLMEKLTTVKPEKALEDLLASSVGAYLFEREYGRRGDARYERAFRELELQSRAATAYEDFPSTEAYIEGPFDAALLADESKAIRSEIGKSGPRDREFRAWFLASKAETLLEKERKTLVSQWEERYRSFVAFVPGTPPLESLMADPDYGRKRDEQIRLEILERVYQDPAALEPHVKEWELGRLATLKDSLRDKAASGFLDRFRAYYLERQSTDPAGFRHSFDTYLRLEAAYREGRDAFMRATEELDSGTDQERLEQAHRDFQGAQQRALSRKWMTGPVATKLLGVAEEYAQSGFKTLAVAIREGIGHLVTIPVQLLLSLLLALFISLDLPRLKRGVMSLEQSRARRVYRELAPGLASLGGLVAKAFQAQGIFAIVTTILTWGLLYFLDLQSRAFLSAIVFVTSFIPVLGAFLGSIPIGVMALVQEGGSVWLCIQVVVGIIVIHFIGTSIIFPKILGDMMELHPVLVLAVLALGEHFFGVWGLILGVPVTVYIIDFVLFGKGEETANT